MSTSSLLLLACVSSFSFLPVTAAPNRSAAQEEGEMIGPKNFEDPELISSATTCQTAILRCCTPDTPTTNATWRCFEKNSCGGLFVVHSKDDTDQDNISLGACAFLSKVKELVDEEDKTESTKVSVRNEGNPFAEEEEEVDDLANTHTDGSPQSDSSESNNDPSKDKISRNPTNQRNPANQITFVSRGCHGGSNERCIKDEEGGCGALEQADQEAYVKCVHHCVDHCKSPRDNLVA